MMCALRMDNLKGE